MSADPARAMRSLTGASWGGLSSDLDLGRAEATRVSGKVGTTFRYAGQGGSAPTYSVERKDRDRELTVSLLCLASSADERPRSVKQASINLKSPQAGAFDVDVSEEGSPSHLKVTRPGGSEWKVGNPLALDVELKGSGSRAIGLGVQPLKSKASLRLAAGRSTPKEKFVKDKYALRLDADGRQGSWSFDFKAVQSIQRPAARVTLETATKAKAAAVSQKVALKLAQGSSASAAWSMKKKWAQITLPLEAEIKASKERKVKIAWEPRLGSSGEEGGRRRRAKYSVHATGVVVLERFLAEAKVGGDQSATEVRAKPSALPGLEVSLTLPHPADSSDKAPSRSLSFKYESQGYQELHDEVVHM